jgi:hypothetical protein
MPEKGRTILSRCPFLVSVIIFCLLLLGVEGLSYVALKGGLWAPAPATADADLAKIYPGQPLGEVKTVLHESWVGIEYRYRPFVEYELRPRTGQFVNVQNEGYRSAMALPWPPPPDAIFLFGGSTTFGIGVRDTETINYYLSERLHRSVYNFSVPAYYSTPERVRFFTLVTEGVVPRTAVFIDGMNDFIFFDVPDKSKASKRLEFALDTNYRYIVLRILSQLNTVKFVASLTNQPEDFLLRERRATPEQIRKAAQRLIRNREIVNAFCEARAIECLFVTQPVPTVNYDASRRPVQLSGDYFGAENCVEGYRFLAGHYGASLSLNVLDLSGVESPEPTYVDNLHYSAGMNQVIAARIADAMKRLSHDSPSGTQ